MHFWIISVVVAFAIAGAWSFAIRLFLGQCAWQPRESPHRRPESEAERLFAPEEGALRPAWTTSVGRPVSACDCSAGV